MPSRISRLSSSSIDLYDFSSTILMIVSSGNRILSWLLVLSSMCQFGRFDKKWLCLACLPFNSWIGLEHQRVLWLVNAVSLFGNRGIQISQSSNMFSCMLGLFPDNKFIVLLTICAIIIHLRRSIFMSLTEVAVITFEKMIR